MSNINEDIGWLRTGTDVGVCADCGEEKPNRELNYEATIHHGARKVVCLKRKPCTKRKKSLRKKAKAEFAEGGIG